MSRIPRQYSKLLRNHLATNRQMAFLTGPRQVGKTTTCRELAPDLHYFNWDDQDDRRLITTGPRAVLAELDRAELKRESPLVVFDELHKYSRWRTFLKGLFDKEGERLSIVVTGSARLEVYRRGGDSLMGRYFPFHMHPLSVGELLDTSLSDGTVSPPRQLSETEWTRLWTHGGFPEPFTKNDNPFSRRWRKLRVEQLVRGDVRDLTRIQELGQLEVMTVILNERSGGQLSYSSLAREVNISVDTARRWVAALGSLYHGFLVRPWYRNVSKSLRKEPKWYLRDWSGIADSGARAETFVACHLLKAVQAWQDIGVGEFELRYLRDKLKREVDFVVIRDREPWFLVEVKSSDRKLSPALAHFQQMIDAPHAFQAVVDAPYVDADCFTRTDPAVVPARTLLSQLP